MRLAMTFPAQHDAIKQRRIRSASTMKFKKPLNRIVRKPIAF